MVVHISSAYPFCPPKLSQQLLKALRKTDATVHEGGTFVTIEGPRFSTRGESNAFRQLGFSLVGMTASPEAYLAREAEICYATMAHVTDYDCWHVSEEAVTVEMVVNTLKKNTQIAQQSLVYLVDVLAEEEQPPAIVRQLLKRHHDQSCSYRPSHERKAFAAGWQISGVI